MERFGLNTAKSFLGKNVNLHLKDGSVIINVQVAEISKDQFGKKSFMKCVSYRNRGAFRVPLQNIAWAEMLNLSLISAS